MNRAWLIDLVSALVVSIAVGLILYVSGAPTWAQIGFALTVYLQHPPQPRLVVKR